MRASLPVVIELQLHPARPQLNEIVAQLDNASLAWLQCRVGAAVKQRNLRGAIADHGDALDMQRTLAGVP